jgi:hypothetical protein
MDIKSNKECKLAKNAFGKYVSSSGVGLQLFTLIDTDSKERVHELIALALPKPCQIVVVLK